MNFKNTKDLLAINLTTNLDGDLANEYKNLAAYNQPIIVALQALMTIVDKNGLVKYAAKARNKKDALEAEMETKRRMLREISDFEMREELRQTLNTQLDTTVAWQFVARAFDEAIEWLD